MSHKHIHEAIEACRPGRDDFTLADMEELAELLESDPEIRERFETVQRGDAEIAAAFQDVPVPAGLCDRLLASVVHPPQAAAGWDEAVDAKPETESLATPLRKSSRRPLWLVAATVAAAACFVLLALRPAPTVSLVELEAATQGWAEQAVAWPDEQWRTASPPLATHPIDRAVRTTAARWHPLSVEYDRQAVAYELAMAGRGRALLFVVRSSQPFEVPALPAKTIVLSGGWSAGAWKSGEHLYVLAVRDVRLNDLLAKPSIAANVRSSAPVSPETVRADVAMLPFRPRISPL